MAICYFGTAQVKEKYWINYLKSLCKLSKKPEI
jgi:hypothetical protein